MSAAFAMQRLGLAALLSGVIGFLGGWGPLFVALAMMAIPVLYRIAYGEISWRLEGYSLTEQTVKYNNHAVGYRYGGAILGLVVAVTGVLQPTGLGAWEDFNRVASYGMLFILLIMLSKILNDKFILYEFNNNQKVVAERNDAVAIIEAATYVATGLNLRGALLGSLDYGLWAALVGFTAGQILIVAAAYLYRKVFMPGVGDALSGNNTAAAWPFGGFLVSAGWMIGSTMVPAFRKGALTEWLSDLSNIAIHAGGWMLLMLVAYIIFDILTLRGSRARDEIMDDKNTGIGFMAAVFFAASTLIFTTVWQ